jgi:hypothetical protein
VPPRSRHRGRPSIKTHYSKTLVLQVSTVQSCTGAYANVLVTGKQKLLLCLCDSVPNPQIKSSKTRNVALASCKLDWWTTWQQMANNWAHYLLPHTLLSLPGICPTMWYLIYDAASTLNTGKQQVGLIETTELNRIFNKHMPTWAHAHKIMRLK